MGYFSFIPTHVVGIWEIWCQSRSLTVTTTTQSEIQAECAHR